MTNLEKAIWEGDLDWLNEHAGCDCCCDEHFFEHCPARAWNGCRGQYSMTHADIKSWADHYGMTLEEFYGYD